ncbi:chorismate mutase family protein [Streptomyces bambusae]|uniref:Chorismate mutase family protein n=1 Tax=Streptomyces bambusae TaxID=1550616 RepID=A0ABS6Z109_9ACTN|nr:chorismate mutase family protein [Streptomyces bambusae]MBW5481412.1 chorismate mutase family protein [Streptomyces bambusae]
MKGTAQATAGIDELRARLDRIDERLLDELRARIEICVEIARVKKDQGIPMMQPHRIGLVQERAAAYGADHGIDLEFLRRLYDLVIEETCRVEDLVIAGSAA